jgi:hypothetical protein
MAVGTFEVHLLQESFFFDEKLIEEACIRQALQRTVHVASYLRIRIERDIYYFRDYTDR